jgi:predicted metalloprotease with PDZ domain
MPCLPTFDRAVLRFGCCLLALLSPLLAGAATESPCDIDFEVTPRYDATPRVLEVSLRFRAEQRRETFLRMTPSWAGINNFGAALGGFAGATPQITVEPVAGEQRWRIAHATQQTVALRYQVRAALADPDDGRPQAQEQLYRPQLGRDWFQFFGHGLFPSLEHWGDNRHARMCVTLHQPGLQQAPAFGSHHAGRGERVRAEFAGSPDLLRGAFFAGGMGWRLQERPVAGAVLRTAVRGRFDMADERFADATAALVNSHRRFWRDAAGQGSGEVPWFVLTPNFERSNVGGTLVHQAAVMHAGSGFSPTHPSFEFLVGHEHLHQWIPGRFGSLGDDPVKSVHGYWFSEGFTNYYTHRLLLASGLWTLPRYAQELTSKMRQYWRSPARNTPVAQIAPRFFADRDAGQQLYGRGEWLAMRWDRALRAQGHEGLDAVLRSILQPVTASSAGDATLATQRVLAALQPLLGTAAQRDVELHIDQGVDIALEEGLAGPCLSVAWEDVPRWVLGLDPVSFETRVATGVLRGGPAYEAGVRDGMPLLGWSVYQGDVQQEVELTLGPDSPQGQARPVRYRPVDGSAQRLPTAHVRDGAESSAACQAWLRR